MKRELSLEERINLTSVVRNVTQDKRYTYDLISQGLVNTTVEGMHARLDNWFIPRFTECPYPLVCVDENLRNGKRLDLARVTEDGALEMTSEVIRKKLFVLALEGQLSRGEPAGDRYRMVYTLKMHDREPIECEKGDMIIWLPNQEVYALTICPKVRQKANAQSDGAV